MIDITNDKFWESDYELPKRKEFKESSLKKFISEHKFMTAMLISLVVLTATNTWLIYNFISVLRNFKA